MNILLISISLSLVISIAHVKAEEAVDAENILYDPFQKPILIQSSLKNKSNVKSSTPSWKPHLIMTLRAGKNSMANVGGEIIRLGDSIAGYKLIQIDERAVVFMNQGKTTRLTLDEDNGIHENL